MNLYYTNTKISQRSEYLISLLDYKERKRLLNSSSTRLMRRISLIEMLFILFGPSGVRNFRHNAEGKPFIGDSFMSVSYSDTRTFCAVSQKNIGIDAERMVAGKASALIPIFNNFYNSNIRDSFSFYKEWTRLESIVKYSGNASILSYIHKKIVHDNLITVFCLLNNDIITAVSSEEEQMIIPIEIKYESND